jgi:hypothetical protein
MVRGSVLPILVEDCGVLGDYCWRLELCRRDTDDTPEVSVWYCPGVAPIGA